jgi:hypothetical protein
MRIATYLFLGALSLAPLATFAAMTSSSYYITIDSINFAGNYSTSSSYSMQDTAGEIATGNSSSTDYAMNAGYQQMYTSYISIGSLSPVTLPSINGLGGAASTSTLPISVVTDNPAGYSLSVQATSSPALKNTVGGSFADYSPAGSPPDFTFAIASNTSAFGFSVQGTNAASRYLNNGSVCNSGASNTSFTCWDGFSTSSKIIAQSSGPNNPGGATTTIDLEAKVGSNKIQDSGTYTATLTVTAVTL